MNKKNLKIYIGGGLSKFEPDTENIDQDIIKECWEVITIDETASKSVLTYTRQAKRYCESLGKITAELIYRDENGKFISQVFDYDVSEDYMWSMIEFIAQTNSCELYITLNSNKFFSIIDDKTHGDW